MNSLFIGFMIGLFVGGIIGVLWTMWLMAGIRKEMEEEENL